MFSIRLIGADGVCRAEIAAQDEAALVLREAYREGDALVFHADTPFAEVQVDAAVAPALVYLPTGEFTYRLPMFGDGHRMFAPFAFLGETHMPSIRRADKPVGRRCLSRNPADQRGDVTAFPHAAANVETRGESIFAARNVIDGCFRSDAHGSWPYHSWGIGAREDAWLRLDFGREVRVDDMALYIRTDFPHDAHWTQGVVVLSDGAEIAFPMEKTAAAQRVALGGRRVTWLRLERLVKCAESSVFPSLKQWEVFGEEI